MKGIGFVSIVGAGPGDPDLVTLKAAERLARADLVLYDALVAPETLALAGRAQRFYVGKRAGRRAIEQEAIHKLMIRAARRGRRVVRLKGGDPFLLGRGGEEAVALVAAGIPFEVVPGVSAALAAPAAAGIPVTHRGVASGVVIVSGHAESAYGSIVDGLVPGCATLVFLMGVGSRGEIADRLVGRGWSPQTPAAVIWAASTDAETQWLGSLAILEDASVAGTSDAPGTIVVGDVVRSAGPIAAAMYREPVLGRHDPDVREGRGGGSA